MNLHRRCLIAIAVLLALSSSQALAQIAFVKTIGTTPSTSNGTSLTVTVPAAGVAGGNSVIVSLGFDPASGSVSCSDSHGNSYAVDKDITNGSGKSGVRVVIFSAHNIVALTNGNTITCTHPSAGARAMSANEFSGLATSATRDQTSSGTGNSTAASSGSTPTTTQASELVLGTIGVEGKSNESFTVGSSYTSIGRTGTNQGSAASNITINPEYRLITTTGAYNASGTLGTSTKWAAAIVTYKAVPSTATKLVITSVNGGSNPIAGTAFSVVVQSQNASGIPTNVSVATGVSLSRKTGTGTLGGTLSGTLAAGSNQTTITGVTYTKAESAVVITATRTSGDNLSPGDSASFTVNPGAANKLAFLTPSGSSTAGSVLSGPPTVAVQDSLGNTVTSSSASITVAIGTNPGGGVLSGTTSKNASGGVTSFSDLSINRAGTGYTLTASATGLTSATSSVFNISAAAAIKVAFTTQPASANAGSAIAGPPSVTVQDNFGNTVTSSSAPITIAIGTNPGGGSLSGNLTMNATSGVASFSNLSVNKSGAGYTLTASATGLTGATSGGFNIAAGAAAKLAYTTAPGNSTAGNTIAGPPSVTVQDSFGNTVTSSTASITVAIGMNPGSGTLSGTITKNAVSGVANFNDLSVEKSGTGYTLAASATGLTGATSSAFNVSAGAANKLAFSVQPGNAGAGAALSGPPTVVVQDSLGNTITSSSASITIAIGNNPSGGTLSGTTTKNAVAGVASFNDLSINQAGNTYTLTGSAAGLTGDTSTSFNITGTTGGAAAKLAFIVQPGNSTAGSSLAGPPSIVVQDSLGNTITTSTASITVEIAANPGSGVLTGTTTRNASSGVAVFTGLSITQPGTGYTLTATSSGLTTVTSTSFNVASSSVSLAATPTSVPAGASFTVTWTQIPNATNRDWIGLYAPGSSDTAYLDWMYVNCSRSPSVPIASGSCSFPISSSRPPGTYEFRLLSNDTYTRIATSNAVTVFTVSGAATNLAFVAQPANAAAGSALSGPPMVAVQDGLGNIVTASTASITVAIGSNPGGGILSGTATKNAVAGVAAFNGLSINQPGIGYTLSATSNGLSAVTSALFNVTSSSVTLATTPTSVPAGASFTVTWAQIPNSTNRDWIGLYAPGSSDTAYLDWLYVNCSRSPSVPIASGTCSFPISSSRPPGTYEFRLLPNDTYTRIATSNAVAVSAAINKLAISVSQNITAGTPGFSIVVESRSPSGAATNVSSNTAITVSVKTGTGTLGGTVNGTILAGTSQVTIGLATYTRAETGVVLTAARTSGDTLISGDTAPFTVSPGAAARLAFTTQPGNAAAKSTIPGPPTVTVQDNAGNTVTSSTHSISIAIGTNPGAGTLSGNMTVTSSASVSFPALSINQPGNGYTLAASAAGLTSAISNPFNITSPTGTGIIAGVITRVSNGATITGALVEAFQGTALRGTAVTNSSGNYSTTGLATGTYTVRASFAGLVPQMLNSVIVSSGNTTTVDLSLNFGIAVQTPVAGATVGDFSVLVTGHFDTSLASEVGITVNGYVALQDGDEFSTFVPIDSQTTMLTATLKNTTGNLIAGDAVPITPQLPSTPANLFFVPSPAITLVSQPVSFTLTSVNPFTQVQLDGNGDGSIDFTDTSLQGVSVSFAEPGLYFPSVQVTEQDGTVRTATSLIQVVDSTQLDAAVQSKWTAMKNALRQGDINLALTHIVLRRRLTYQAMFNALTIPLANIDQVLTGITLVDQRGIEAEYEMFVTQGGTQYSYLVLFALDEDGVWRVKFF